MGLPIRGSCGDRFHFCLPQPYGPRHNFFNPDYFPPPPAELRRNFLNLSGGKTQESRWDFILILATHSGHSPWDVLVLKLSEKYCSKGTHWPS